MTVGHASRARDGGDVVVAALATVLGRTRDRLAVEGLTDAAELVADLAEAAHDYLESRGARGGLDRTAEQTRGGLDRTAEQTRGGP